MSKREKKKVKKATQKVVDKDGQIKRLRKQVKELVGSLERERGQRCFLLEARISPSLVDEIYTELRKEYKALDGKLDIIINSPGGDIDAAYNLSSLFKKYGHQRLTFIIPRWAKSAATLLACAGDEILMTPVAELGPLDPQITQINPMEERIEQFSPLHVQTTLEMIRNEYKEGNKDLAEGLLKRLQFPLTLGSFMKAPEIAKQYLVRLLKERMEKTGKLGAKAEEIADRLTKDYADHGFCINMAEAKKIGLNVQELDEDQLNIVWDLYGTLQQVDEIERKQREEDIMKTIEKLPPEILKKVKSKANETEREETEK
jgi:hypothetical protein